MWLKQKKRQSLNPMMDFVNVGEYTEFLSKCINDLEKTQNVLDVGGGRGKTFKNGNCGYYVLDINSHNSLDYIQGDITSKDLSLNKKFDIILTKDTFEHILNPWDATENILNLLEEGGLFFCSVPFSWRFHPSPYDCYRYSHQGLKYLFERKGGMEEVDSGYIHYFDAVQGFWKNKLDNWPINNLYRDNICSYYIGQKKKDKKFNIEEIRGDFSLNHDTPYEK